MPGRICPMKKTTAAAVTALFATTLHAQGTTDDTRSLRAVTVSKKKQKKKKKIKETKKKIT